MSLPKAVRLALDDLRAVKAISEITPNRVQQWQAAAKTLSELTSKPKSSSSEA